MSRFAVSLLAPALLVSALPQLAVAAQVHRRAVKLPVALDQANLVVIARWAKPFYSIVELPLKLPKGKRAKGKAAKGKKAPRYRKGLRHFVISAVLRDRSGKSRGQNPRFAKGETIAVAAANWHLAYAMTRSYHLRQPMPSPIVTHYKGGVKLDHRAAKATPATKRQQMILLLYADGKGQVRFAIGGGALPLSLRKKVEKLLRGPRARRGGRARSRR